VHAIHGATKASGTWTYLHGDAIKGSKHYLQVSLPYLKPCSSDTTYLLCGTGCEF
jgi:hypothetical protein